MNFTAKQKDLLNQIKEMIETRDVPSELFMTDLCEAFGGHIGWSFHGIGGTRLVISHPEMGMVLKIAYREDGIEGNKDEYQLYHESPKEVKPSLGEVGELLEDGLVLEMKYYEQMKEEEFDDYEVQLNQLLEKINFIHYQYPPYFHSFGISGDGTLILFDYGETEKISFIL